MTANPANRYNFGRRCALLLVLCILAARAGAAEATPDQVLGLSPRQQVVVAGAAAGSFAGQMFDVATDHRFSPISPIAGAALGSVPGLLTGDLHDPSASAGLRTFSLAGWGAWSAWEVGRLSTEPDAGPALPAIAAGVGDLGGLSIALWVPGSGSMSAPDWLALDGAGLAGWLASDGALSLAGADDQRLQAGAELAGGAVMMGASALGRRSDHWHAGAARHTLWTVQGGWIGTWMPSVFHPSPPSQQVQGGAAIGAAVGWTAASLLDWKPRSMGGLTSAGAWAVAGSALGQGAGGLAGTDPVATTAMLAGGLAGTATGTALSRRTGAPGDPTFLVLGQGLAIIDAVTWSLWAQEAGLQTRQARSVGFLSFGIESAATLAVPAALDFDGGQALAATSAGAWGHWFGGAGGLAFHAPAGPHAAATGALGVLGLAAGTVAAQGPWHPSVRQVVLLDGSGLLGGAIGGLGAAAVTTDLAGRSRGALVGSVGGLAFGAWLSHGAAGPDPMLPRPHLRLPWRVEVAPGPWTDPHGKTGLFVQASVLSARR